MAWIAAKVTKSGNVIGVFHSDDGRVDICRLNADQDNPEPGDMFSVESEDIVSLIALLQESGLTEVSNRGPYPIEVKP